MTTPTGRSNVRTTKTRTRASSPGRTENARDALRPDEDQKRDPAGGLGSSVVRAQPRTHTELPEPPPRRAGRECGYAHRDELLAANRLLGAALTKLARDSDPVARAAGAAIAAELAGLVAAAARLASESSGKNRRAAAQVARMLPKLQRQLVELQARVGRSVRNL